MSSNFNAPRARASCNRCHKRKKKCDRFLPACKNCHSAQVRCSFLDDQGQSASYPIEYVRSLEEKIRILEKTVLVDNVPGPRISTEPAGPIFVDESQIDFHAEETGFQNQEDGMVQGALEDHGTAISNVPECPIQDNRPSPSLSTRAPNFADELRTLSLEATAEQHLGSMSGVSFAKLTQTVLRRLTPDKADFVFQHTNVEAALFDLNSPSELFNESIFNSLSGSISVHPLLFGDIFLSDITVPDTTLNDLAWPSDESYVRRLVDFYFAHSHTLYPILKRSDIMKTLERIRGNPQHLADLPTLEAFRLWMVLAIGSTAYSSVLLGEESESIVYYSKALQLSDKALEICEMSALEVIMLQVSYSFFNQLGPNTWFLVGTAARLALGMGLHSASTYTGLPFGEQERRKRIFFSIYMMDRVVSVALGRPFALHDDDIDVEPFSDIDEDEDTRPEGITLRSLHPNVLAVPLHILALRRIASKISRKVYPSRKNANFTEEERDEVLSSLHQELLEWRRNTPFPLPDIHDGVPHLNNAWYDFNYFTHLAMIYRPSPLCPILDIERLKLLKTAASMSVRQAFSMHQQRRFAYNWLNFLSLFTSTLSLIYSVTAQPDDLPTVLRDSRAIEDLDLCIQLFGTFEKKFLVASKIRTMIEEVSRRYKAIQTAQLTNQDISMGDPKS